MIDENIKEQIIKYLKQGKSMGQISKILNYPRPQVKECVMEMVEAGVDLSRENNEEDNKEKIDRKILELKAKEMNYDDIAIEVKKSVFYVKRIIEMNEMGVDISKYKKARNFDEISKQIIQMMEEGLSQTKIAKKTGISHQAVSQRIKRMREAGVEIPKAPNSSKKKIDEIDKKIIQMLQEGMSKTEIAKKIGMSCSNTYDRVNRMKKSGVEIPKVQRNKIIDEKDKIIIQLRQQGLSQQEIGCKLNLSQSTIARRVSKIKKADIDIPDIPRPKRKKFLDERDIQIIQMIEEGLSQGKIAKKIGVSRQRISQRMKKIKEIEELKKDKINEETAKYINLSKEDIEKAILNLAKTRNATFEQMQKIAQSYDIDLSRTLYSVDMEER